MLKNITKNITKKIKKKYYEENKEEIQKRRLEDKSQDFRDYIKKIS